MQCVPVEKIGAHFSSQTKSCSYKLDRTEETLQSKTEWNFFAAEINAFWQLLMEPWIYHEGGSFMNTDCVRDF